MNSSATRVSLISQLFISREFNLKKFKSITLAITKSTVKSHIQEKAKKKIEMIKKKKYY